MSVDEVAANAVAPKTKGLRIKMGCAQGVTNILIPYTISNLVGGDNHWVTTGHAA